MLELVDQEESITYNLDLVVERREIWSCNEAVVTYCHPETHGANACQEKK